MLAVPNGVADDCFGSSITISGNIVIIGAWGDADHGNVSGSAHVFFQNRVTWLHQTKLLTPNGAAPDQFGWIMAIYGDAVIVGAFGDNDNKIRSGLAHIFVENGVTWSHQSKLLAPDGSDGVCFGLIMGIHGGTSIVGGYRDDKNGEEGRSAHVFF